MNEPTQTTGRHPFVIVGKYRGGTRIHITDDPMYGWSLEWGTSTNVVDALCGQHTRRAVPADHYDYESDEMKPCPKCHRIAKEEER